MRRSTERNRRGRRIVTPAGARAFGRTDRGRAGRGRVPAQDFEELFAEPFRAFLWGEVPAARDPGEAYGGNLRRRAPSIPRRLSVLPGEYQEAKRAGFDAAYPACNTLRLRGEDMEFLNFVLMFAAAFLLLRRPEKERLAFRLVVVSVLLMVALFTIATRTALLPGVNY